MHRLVLCAVIALLAAVKSVSTDGEATVYLMGNFTGKFDVAYYALMKPGASNTSWSTLNILLIGTKVPGAGANVGVASNGAGSNAVTAYTEITYPSMKSTYVATKTNCDSGCVVELRGDTKNIYAYVNDAKLATWPRAVLMLRNPSFQLNAETHGVGDSIEATLTPVRLTSGSSLLRAPVCAFTTRGVQPSGRLTLTFRGTNKNADGEFVNLKTGVHADKC